MEMQPNDHVIVKPTHVVDAQCGYPDLPDTPQPNKYIEVKRAILPLCDLLEGISPQVAHEYRHTKEAHISTAVNTALYAWSKVLYVIDHRKTDRELLEEARAKIMAEPAVMTQQIPNPHPHHLDLWAKFFLVVAPYMRALMCHPRIVLDNVQWCENVGGDMVVEVTYLSLW